MKRNDRGFTLVELIIVVAILGACLGIVGFSISTIFSAQARKTAKELDSAIAECRINALSRAAEVYMTVSADADGAVHVMYYENDALMTDDVIGTARISVSYALDSGADTLLAPGGTALRLSFLRDTGEFAPASGTAYCTSITVAGGGRTYVITLVPVTGAHTLKG